MTFRNLRFAEQKPELSLPACGTEAAKDAWGQQAQIDGRFHLGIHFESLMFEISIARFGPGKSLSDKLVIKTIVSDYTGTLSCGGGLTRGVEDRLRRLKVYLDIHVVSSDSFGTAQGQLAAIPLEPYILRTDKHDEEKREYVQSRPFSGNS